MPPPPLLFPELAESVELDPPDVVVTSPTFAQKLVYQFRMLPRSAGVATHAASQTPAVPAENAVRRASLQKQAS